VLPCASLAYLGNGISAMEKVVQKSVLRGRPFGGTATLLHSKWRTFVKVIARLLWTDMLLLVMVNFY